MRITCLELECEEVQLADGSLETIRYQLFFRVTDPIKLVAQGREENYADTVVATVQGALKDVLRGYSLPLDIYARRRVTEAVTSTVNNEMSRFGVRIEDVQVGGSNRSD